VFDAGGKINERTQLSATTYWDTANNTFTAGEARVRYKDPKQRILNVGYTERKGDFRAANASVALPVKKGWQAVGAVEQDLLNNRNLETVVGAEYQTCCWKSRVVTRNYLLPDNTNRDNAVLVEFELKGLGNFGSGARDLLQNRVYGYE
jgi:LPS-assembly protein